MGTSESEDEADRLRASGQLSMDRVRPANASLPWGLPRLNLPASGLPWYFRLYRRSPVKACRVGTEAIASPDSPALACSRAAQLEPPRCARPGSPQRGSLTLARVSISARLVPLSCQTRSAPRTGGSQLAPLPARYPCRMRCGASAKCAVTGAPSGLHLSMDRRHEETGGNPQSTVTHVGPGGHHPQHAPGRRLNADEAASAPEAVISALRHRRTLSPGAPAWATSIHALRRRAPTDPTALHRQSDGLNADDGRSSRGGARNTTAALSTWSSRPS
jgi:hypothetical protein